MTIRSDPEKNEIRALLGLADFFEKHVIEIGCGDGRLTRRYAETAAYVTAIDPFEAAIKRARANLPDALRQHVKFVVNTFDDFAASNKSDLYDIAILSWSL